MMITNKSSKRFVLPLTLLGLSLGVAGCNSSSEAGSSSSPQASVTESQKQTTPTALATEPQMAPTGLSPSKNRADDEAAKDAFLKTFASGQKTMKFQNAVIEFKKTDSKTGAVKSSWTSSCSNDSLPMTLAGNYPAVTFQIGALDCSQAPSETPYELMMLRMITQKLSYQASFIPAGASDPHQFRLTFEGMDDSMSQYVKWTSQESLNALTRDHAVFLDFFGKVQSDLPGEAESSYYLDMNFAQSDDGQSTKFLLHFTADDFGGNEHTEISISADL
jgi:hypothetical protein